MALLNKQDILQAQDDGYEDVNVPEWGEGASVRVRTMSGAESDTFLSGQRERYGPKGEILDIRGFKTALLVHCLVDETGTLLFGVADAGALNEKASGVIDRLAKVAMRLNGLSPDDVEDVRKNSEAGRT